MLKNKLTVNLIGKHDTGNASSIVLQLLVPIVQIFVSLLPGHIEHQDARVSLMIVRWMNIVESFLTYSTKWSNDGYRFKWQGHKTPMLCHTRSQVGISIGDRIYDEVRGYCWSLEKPVTGTNTKSGWLYLATRIPFTVRTRSVPEVNLHFLTIELCAISK